jgi:predicted urease superfamily metal-dependent hydrolase
MDSAEYILVENVRYYLSATDLATLLLGDELGGIATVHANKLHVSIRDVLRMSMQTFMEQEYLKDRNERDAELMPPDTTPGITMEELREQIGDHRVSVEG